MNHVLIGNAFSLTLVRNRKVVVSPWPLEELRDRIRAGAEVHSFWGHENTRAAAERILGADLKPATPRPAITLAAQEGNLPSLDGIAFRECWVLSPNYAPGYRPAIGEVVDKSKIADWNLLKLTWMPKEDVSDE